MSSTSATQKLVIFMFLTNNTPKKLMNQEEIQNGSQQEPLIIYGNEAKELLEPVIDGMIKNLL